MKRFGFGLLVLLALLAGPVMGDDTPPSWTINNGSAPGIGLTGTYPSAPAACTAWYQHWQSVYAGFSPPGVATYESPTVVTNPHAPTATTELCQTPVSAFGGQFTESTYLTRAPSCQSGETFNPDTDKCITSNTDAGKNAGASGDCSGGVGSVLDNKVSCNGTVMGTDPVNMATGNKFEQDTDFLISSWLTFRRFYNSTSVPPSTLGPQWRHSFDRSMGFQSAGTGGSANPTIRLYRPDGSSEPFQKIGGVWVADADVPDTLTEQDDISGNPTGYTVFIAPRREHEQYSTAGLLESITDASGQTTTLVYSTASTPASVAPTPNLLLTVTDPNDRQLNFTYNSNGTLAQITEPDGGTLTYTYNASGGTLSSVRYPDGKTLQYLYNEPSLNAGVNQPTVLTGVIDETTTRFASTSYSGTGQATSFTLAGGANASTVTYSGAGSSTLDTPLGVAVGIVAANDGAGTIKLASTSVPCGTQCSQPWKQQTYDANGYPASYTDFNNNVTATTYSSAGLLTQQIDAQGTASQRTTKTTWNTMLRVPLLRVVQDANNNTVSSTQWVYNTAGQTLARCEIDPTNSAASGYACSATGAVPAGVRRWTYTYCTAVDGTQCPIVGLLLSSTGPRADVVQTTSYSYYLDSATSGCPTPGGACHQPGDLHTVADPLGHVTTVASYDADGHPTRITDANGINTDLTYTPRGWLASRTVGGATTTFGYTPYGAVSSVTDPDGVATAYGYDPAHRLVKVTDAQGNYVQYTLDAAGDKTAEQVFDSNGTAHQSLSRTFNALGQLTMVVDGLNHTVFNASAAGSYDANGNLVQSSDGLGIQRQQSYDALNRLVQTIDNYNGTN